MKKSFGKGLTAAGLFAALLVAVIMPISAEAYGPSTMYTPPSDAPKPGALYPRAIQATNGKMYATFEQYTSGIASFPIFESLDNGQTWKKVGDVKDTKMSWGMRWEPQLYQLPEAIGDMPAGTLLASGLVLPFDESKCQIDLYKSNDEGRTWQFVSTIATGGKAVPGDNPVWEPFLIVANKKLYCFYSDETDNAYSQKLVHKSTADGKTWSAAVNDVALTGLRPGMVSVAQMPNGNYIMTYEIVGGEGGAWYKTSSDIDNWRASDKGDKLDGGSSPYVITMNGTIIISSAGSNDLYTNANNAVGTWGKLSVPIGTNYSRCIVPLSNGRIFVMGAGWNQKSSLNTVTYADKAFGCEPSAIDPFLQVNGGEWQNVSADTINEGASIVMGPHPVATTGWSWTGPDGFTATTREITLSGVTASKAGTYTATYSNATGCKSSQKYTLTVNATTNLLNIHGGGNKQMQITVNDHLKLQILGGGAELRITNLKGVSVYQKSITTNELAIPELKPGVYVISILRDNALLAKKTFMVE